MKTPRWNPMDVVYQDTLLRPRCLILSASVHGDRVWYEAVSESDGYPTFTEDSTMTQAEWLKWLAHFSDDLTGRQIREAREAATAPLVEPESWGGFRKRFVETGDPWISLPVKNDEGRQ